jgi:DNA-binding CsgD family transcriptional regulator
MSRLSSYTIFHDFIAKYQPNGFQHISRLDPFIVAMEETLRANNQFFYIADLIQIKILFTSWESTRMIGVNPWDVDPSTFFPLAHTEDQERLNRAQTRLYKAGQELYNSQGGHSLVSIQIRESNNKGSYFDLLLQTYSYFSEKPAKTVYTLIVATDLTGHKLRKNWQHYYAGTDLTTFRYPDEALLMMGHDLSDRELEILNLIAKGMGSEQIADKLSLSVNTVNTHRRNMLKKTRKSTTHDLVVELQEQGVL